MSIHSLMLVVLAAAHPAVAGGDSEKKPTRARVYVPDSASWSMGDELGVLDWADGLEVVGGARPQTAEIVKTLHERCPELIVTRKEERADYVLVLEHEGGKDLIRRDNKYAVFDASGDAIASGSTRLLGNSIKDACKAMRSDWKHRDDER